MLDSGEHPMDSENKFVLNQYLLFMAFMSQQQLMFSQE
jgi:hypothetical protein